MYPGLLYTGKWASKLPYIKVIILVAAHSAPQSDYRYATCMALCRLDHTSVWL